MATIFLPNPNPTVEAKSNNIKPAVRKFAASIKADGFERAVYEDAHLYGDGRTANKLPGAVTVVLTVKNDVVIYFRLQPVRPGGLGYYDAGATVEIDGTVEFNTSKGWRSYDRIGVESSFDGADQAPKRKCKDRWPTIIDVPKLIAEQLAKIAESRKRLSASITLPGELSAWSLTPERIEVFVRSLAQRQSVVLTPAGFGTGYRITARPNSHCKRASKVVADFFKQPALWLETMDCD